MKRLAAERPICSPLAAARVVRYDCSKATGSHHVPHSTLRGFSLLELIVVIAVATILAGLLMPTLRHVHENAHRIICLAHLQQMGQAFMMYDATYDSLPYAATLEVDDSPFNLMTAHRPGPNGGWDGLGLLYSLNFCPVVGCYYCPSHHGQHNIERYADRWINPQPYESIFTNYHYAGHMDWDGETRRRLEDGVALVLATDGLRTAEDFNHVDGMNVLRGDGSARWRDNTEDIRSRLPLNESQLPAPAFELIWDLVCAD